jgi:hypothetical protein
MALCLSLEDLGEEMGERWGIGRRMERVWGIAGDGADEMVDWERWRRG